MSELRPLNSSISVGLADAIAFSVELQRDVTGRGGNARPADDLGLTPPSVFAAAIAFSVELQRDVTGRGGNASPADECNANPADDCKASPTDDCSGKPVDDCNAKPTDVCNARLPEATFADNGEATVPAVKASNVSIGKLNALGRRVGRSLGAAVPGGLALRLRLGEEQAEWLVEVPWADGSTSTWKR